jgi:hypothetical protein
VTRPRVAAAYRGWFIAGFLAVYGWFVQQPGAAREALFLVGAAVQLAILLVRRFVPAEARAEVLDICEYVADGVSVLLFALGVQGGIAAQAAEF